MQQKIIWPKQKREKTCSKIEFLQSMGLMHIFIPPPKKVFLKKIRLHSVQNLHAIFQLKITNSFLRNEVAYERPMFFKIKGFATTEWREGEALISQCYSRLCTIPLLTYPPRGITFQKKKIKPVTFEGKKQSLTPPPGTPPWEGYAQG